MKLGIPFALMGLIATNAFSTVVIDDFTTPTTQENHSSQGGQVQWTDNSTAGSILGDYRDGSVGCELTSEDNQVNVKIGTGKFEVTAQPKAGPSIYLSYDGTAGWSQPADPENDRFNGTFASAIDLTDGGANDRFSFSFAYAFGGKVGPETVTFNDFKITLLEYDNGTTNTYSYNGGENTAAGGDDTVNTWMTDNYTDLNNEQSATFEMDFSKFGGASLDDVLALQVHICSADLGSDYTLNSIAAVPEPASAMMIGVVGIIGFFIRRRFID